MSDPEKECQSPDLSDPASGQKQIAVQAVLSLALGATAFICFCVSTAAQDMLI
jgi:hypothetical protein